MNGSSWYFGLERSFGLAAWPLPAWAVMWLIALGLFLTFKWFSLQAALRRATGPDVARVFAYWFAWPGMDAGSFLDASARVPRPPVREWMYAVAKAGLGLWIFFVLARRVPGMVAQGWVGFAGMVMALHFGVFHILSLLWRANGVDAEPIMNRPLLARTLGVFWGRDWNRAFRDTAHTLMLKPITRCGHPMIALLAVFLFSGLVHELVISVPARGGYGGPLLYFLLQGGGVLLQHSHAGRKAGLSHGLTGRCFTLFVVLAPLGLLFHVPFMERVFVPFMKAVNAM